MHPLTSMAYLSKIAEYQDGIRHKDMKIQPDLAAKAGHVNLLAMKDCFKPTPDAYAATMEQKDPCRTVEHLMNTGIPSDFILGDEASSRGHLDIIKNLLNVKYQKGDQCKHKYHQCHHPFSFKAFRNAISGGHLEILQLLCAYTSADLTHFYPSMYALAAASSQEVVMDWLYNIAGQNGVVPLSIQYDSLVYHIQHCGVDVTPTVRQRHEQRVFHLLAVNPTLLIQCSGLRSGTKAVDCCAAVGNLSLLKVMFAYHGRESHCALDHAAKNGFLPVVRYLTGEGEEDEDEEEDNNDGNGSWSSSGNASGIATPAVSVLDTNTAADNAADAGSNVTDTNSHAQAPEVMMEVDVGVGGDYVYLLTPSVTHRRGKYTIHATNRAITEAAIANHVAVVDYLATHRYEGADNRMFDLVAAEGHLAMLMYISAHLNDHFPNVVITTDALDNAAASKLC